MRIRGVIFVACGAAAVACTDSPTTPSEVINDTPVIEMDTAVRSIAGVDASCAIDATGLTYCWGATGTLLFGGGASNYSSPTATLLGSFSALSRGGSQHACGIRLGGLGVCWGRGGSGQTGHGGLGNIAGDTPDSIVGGYRWKSLYTGRLTTCGITVDGDAYCWGINQAGEVGNSSFPLGGSGTASGTPLLVDGAHKWKQLALGWMHTCGIDTAGVAWCWGSNLSGQLGLGASDTLAHRSPVAVVSGGLFLDLAAGWRHTCGVNTSNVAFCWGANETGQLGNGSTFYAGAPTPVSSGHKFARIAVSMSAAAAGVTPPPTSSQNDRGSSCALTVAGVAYCWGYNGTGQLGDGTMIGSATPRKVLGDFTFTSIMMGSAHTCARRGEQIMCWGANDLSQLGLGAVLTDVIVPSPQLTPSPFNNH